MLSYLVLLSNSFKSFSFSPEDNFEPSVAIRKYWRNTKKVPSTFSGIQLPGLMSTHGYSTQIICFFIIFILEGAATYWGYAQGMIWEAVLGFIIIDIFLAIIAHWWHDMVCQYKNELVVANETAIQKDLKSKIDIYTKKQYIFYFLIVLSGGAKCAFFYSSYLAIDGLLAAVVACYMIGAILHIVFTGYFWFTSRFNFLIWREHDEYVKAHGTVHQIQGHLDRKIYNQNVVLEEATAGKHKIIKNIDGSYYFQLYGLLEDSELNTLILTQQNPAAQGIIAREGLSLQLDQLNVGGQ
jgi:hypothetical protein